MGRFPQADALALVGNYDLLNSLVLIKVFFSPLTNH